MGNPEYAKPANGGLRTLVPYATSFLSPPIPPLQRQSVEDKKKNKAAQFHLHKKTLLQLQPSDGVAIRSTY